jgi:hypothetical protein
MSLPIPNLDDKPFLQIAEEARALIPGTAPEWTDHNVHDPGITFIELFAWLAEIEHYRLNRTSAASFARFLTLAGVTPLGQQAAEVAIVFDSEKLKEGLLVPANTRISALGNEGVPFETMRDTYLTTAKLRRIVTRAGEREIPQMKAELNEAGHYEAFGPSPGVGDYLRLGFEGWFKEQQGHLAITLFEGDLPPRVPFAPGAQGFVPSARVQWEYLSSSGWSKLPVIEDGTLHFSRSGELVFRKPDEPPVLVPTNVDGKKINLYAIRARLVEGHYEIPPRIFSITTNTIRARQVETIVNEDLGLGLGTPDQLVRLKKAPLFLDSRSNDGPFQVGEVLDWRALVMALARPYEVYEPQQAKAVEYVLKSLGKDAGQIIQDGGPLDDDKKYRLAQAFDQLLDMPDFYRRKELPGVSIPEEFTEPESEQARACQDRRVRRFNRFILQRVLADQLVSDRLEIQTGVASSSARQEVKSQSVKVWERVSDFSQCESVAQSNDESKSWSSWERIEDFSQSGPEDRHYILDAETGLVLFGNGLNGRVPQTTESIRARFYRYSRDEEGNLPVGHRWLLAILLPDGKRVELRGENWDAATGGTKPETLDDAKARSRQVFRQQSPVLTIKDYEALALSTPGLRVARAKVVANFNPQLPQLSLPGEVTVVVVPQPAPPAAFPQSPPPTPSDGFRSTVLNHLDTRRLVTTNIHVIGPRYVPVAVRCRVFLKKGAAEKETSESIKKRLDEFLDPIRGGPERHTGWPFGRSVFPSEIHQQLARVTGVDYIVGVSLNKRKAGEPFPLPGNGLPTPGEHKVEIVPFERRGQETDSVKGSGCRD